MPVNHKQQEKANTWIYFSSELNYRRNHKDQKKNTIAKESSVLLFSKDL